VGRRGAAPAAPCPPQHPARPPCGLRRPQGRARCPPRPPAARGCVVREGTGTLPRLCTQPKWSCAPGPGRWAPGPCGCRGGGGGAGRGRCEGRRGIMAENSAPCTAMGAMSARCSTLIPGPSNPQLRALTCPTRPRGVRRDIRRCEGWVSGEGFGVGVGSQQKIAATSQRHTASPTLPTPRSSPQLTHTGFICTGDEGGVRMCRKG